MKDLINPFLVRLLYIYQKGCPFGELYVYEVRLMTV